jgi:cytochrome c551/c552
MIQLRSSTLTALVCFALSSTLQGCDAPPPGITSSNPVVENGCLTCHANDKNILLAPSFSAISQRYSGNSDAAAALANSLRNGSHGKWIEYRDAMMPPQPQLSETEKKALVEWILKQ